MRLGISMRIVGYLINKTICVQRRKRIRENQHCCANFKSGKFWESLSPCNNIFILRN